MLLYCVDKYKYTHAAVSSLLILLISSKKEMFQFILLSYKRDELLAAGSLCTQKPRTNKHG